MNIKPWLEAEADTIVNTFRKQGGDVNDLIAKHASERKIQGDQVHSLVWLVNRHHLKVAKREENADEFAIANPDMVIARMRRGREKTASIQVNHRPGFCEGPLHEGGQAVAAGYVASDPAPIRLAKLASRRMELEQGLKAANASVRAELFRMGMLAESVKRAGLMDSTTFVTEFDRLPVETRPILETVLAHVKSARIPMSGQSRGYVERAIADFGEMTKCAGLVRESQKHLAEMTDRIARVDALATQVRGQEG